MKAIILGVIAALALPTAAQAAVLFGNIETGFGRQSAFENSQSFVARAPLWASKYGARDFSKVLPYAEDRVLPPPTKAQLPDVIDSPMHMPEPQVWAMFLLGFGAVGTLMRRRPWRVAFS